MTATCPHCGGSLTVSVLAGSGSPAPALSWSKDDELPRARPRKIYRGSGADRESAWGASTTVAIEPGQKVRISSRKGRSWIGYPVMLMVVSPAQSALMLAPPSDRRRTVLIVTVIVPPSPPTLQAVARFASAPLLPAPPTAMRPAAAFIVIWVRLPTDA